MKIKNYTYGARILMYCDSVNSYSLKNQYSHDVLLLQDRTLIIASKGSVVCSIDIDVNTLTKMIALHDGDIVTISESGLITRIFDNNEHNATVFITGECNSNCIMCPSSDHERKTNKGMPANWLCEYLYMLPSDIPHFVVTGGEPTIRLDQFIETMHILAKRFPRSEVLLLSNGRSFAVKQLVLNLMEYCPPFLTVGVPLHGHCDTLHDKITQSTGSFMQTCAGIKNLLSAGVAVEIRIVVSKLNSRNLIDITQTIVERFPNVSSVKFMGLEVLGSCHKNYDVVYINHTESWRAIKPAITTLILHGIPTQLYNYPLCAIDKGYWTLCKRSITPGKVRYPDMCNECIMQSQCGGFFSSTLYKANPTVRPIRPRV